MVTINFLTTAPSIYFNNDLGSHISAQGWRLFETLFETRHLVVTILASCHWSC